jgi:S-adenosylmethionine/arginine decarboxylase-like enzyme
MAQGREWIVDAFECAPARITGETGREALMSLFANVIRSVGLHPVGQAVWQLTGVAGAVTGLVALVESHLTCHSDPPSGYLSLNLLSNRCDLSPDWDGLLTRFVGARRIGVRIVERGDADGKAPTAPPAPPAKATTGTPASTLS